MEPETPRVSVVIPCYNAAPYLGEGLRSVLDQTPPPDEVIVVDDGSTDGSSAVAERFGDPVRVIGQRNAGPGAAKNVAIRAARFDLIAFLDADDTWEPRKLELQLPRFARPEVGLVYGQARNVSVPGRFDTIAWPAACPEGMIFDKLYFDNFIPEPTVIARRAAILDLGGFDESLRIGEDFDLWLRLSLRWEFAAVKEPVMRYRRHPAQLTDDQMTPLLALYRVQERFATEYETQTDTSSAVPRGGILQRMMAELWATYYWRRDIRKARELVALITQLYPEPDARTRHELALIRRRSRIPRVVFRVRDMLMRRA